MKKGITAYFWPIVAIFPNTELISKIKVDGQLYESKFVVIVSPPL